MNCPKCVADIGCADEDWTFCPWCGSELVEEMDYVGVLSLCDGDKNYSF